jgi:S1-C subfamily serine protease
VSQQTDLAVTLRSLGLGCGNLGRSWYVTEVAPDSPAAGSGASPGDSILAVDGVPFEAASAWVLRAKMNVGGHVDLQFARGGARMQTALPTGVAWDEAMRLRASWGDPCASSVVVAGV